MVEVMSRGLNGIVNQGADFGGRHVLGRLVHRRDRTSGLGSRPFVHHKKNITINAHSGSSTMELLRKNHSDAVSLLGCSSTPLLM